MEDLWVAIGFLGEAQFGARFILQWFASERQKKSVVPTGFWYLSVGGGITLLTYAIYRLDPVFIIGEAFGLLVVIRNLHFLHRKPRSRLTDELDGGRLGATSAAIIRPQLDTNRSRHDSPLLGE